MDSAGNEKDVTGKKVNSCCKEKERKNIFCRKYFFCLGKLLIFFSFSLTSNQRRLLKKKKKKKNPKFSKSEKRYFRIFVSFVSSSEHGVTTNIVRFFSVTFYFSKISYSTHMKFSQTFGRKSEKINDFWQNTKVCLSKNNTTLTHMALLALE